MARSTVHSIKGITVRSSVCVWNEIVYVSNSCDFKHNSTAKTHLISEFVTTIPPPTHTLNTLRKASHNRAKFASHSTPNATAGQFGIVAHRVNTQNTAQTYRLVGHPANATAIKPARVRIRQFANTLFVHSTDDACRKCRTSTATAYVFNKQLRFGLYGHRQSADSAPFQPCVCNVERVWRTSRQFDTALLL